MTDRVSANLKAFESFLKGKGWTILSRKDVDHGHQVVVTDGSAHQAVNFFSTGKITVQGKPCEMKTALEEWVSSVQPEPSSEISIGGSASGNRVAKYFVIPDNIEKIHQIVLKLPGEVIAKEVGGPAEVYRIEVRHEGHRVTITQYSSGTLTVQGLSNPHFDAVCEALDEHLSQSVVDRATRFIAGERERNIATAYFEEPEAENEATRWLLEQISQDVLDFLYDNDRRTLLAAAGVRNAFKNTSERLPDYSVVVMPFAKSLEGFLMRLALHLELTTEDALKQKANEIEIGTWIDTIKARLPDARRYGDIHATLDAAWQCRHKALHSDFVHPLSTLQTFADADLEIDTILRAMKRAHRLFVEGRLKLARAESRGPGLGPISTPGQQQKQKQTDRDHFRR